jgi:3-phytase
MRTRIALAVITAALSAGCTAGAIPEGTPAATVNPALFTEPVADDADDPAVWIHPADPARSLVLGTNKVAAPRGALVMFGLDGRIRQTIGGLDRPNNVDVEQNVALGGRTLDIAIVTERLKHRLRVFSIHRDSGTVEDLASIPVLEGETGERSEPMGIAIFKRPSDGAVFAIVAPKTGNKTNYLWQYRLNAGADGRIAGQLVRRFGNFSMEGAEPGEIGEIEAIVVDDALGYVYYSDERFGIRKSHANPDHADAARELTVIGRDGYRADREGLAIWSRPDGSGYLVSTDQYPNSTAFKFYRRGGRQGAPHDQQEVVHEILTSLDGTDGIEITPVSLPGFERGLMIAMNSGVKNFALFRWEDVRPKPASN